MPYAFHIKIIVGFDGEDRCNEVWGGMYRIAYGFFTTVTQFVLPFVTIIACYTTIILKLRKRPNERRGLVVQSSQKQDVELKVTIKELTSIGSAMACRPRDLSLNPTQSKLV